MSGDSSKTRHLIATVTLVLVLLVGTGIHAQIAPKIVSGTTEAMQHPEFWISRIDNPDEVVMTPEQIRALNRKNSERPFEITDINGDPYSFRDVIDNKDIIGVQFLVEDPLSIVAFPGDSLRARLDRSHDYLFSRSFWDKRQLEYTEEMKNELIDKTDYPSIPGTITPRYAVIVKHTLNRVFPTPYPGWNSQGGKADFFQSASIDMNTPVAILHETKDGDWYYIRSETTFGWIPAENTAEIEKSNLGSIREAIDPKSFVIATSHKAPIYFDKQRRRFMVDLFLGARLPLLGKTAGGYEVSVPVRDDRGMATYIHGWIGPDADVSVGFPEFTPRNVIETMFSLLYRRYAWADNFNERDCCGTIRSVYRSFGIFLPRWTTHELHSADRVFAFPRDTSSETKHDLVSKCTPGITLVGHRGHISMYIGRAGDKYYTIHQSGYSYEADDGTRTWVQRVNVNDTEFPGGSNVKTWTEIAEFRP